MLSNGKYIPASELQEGMELKTINGKKARITKITDVVLDEPVSVYNLDTKEYDDFILPGGVVVHNSNLDIDIDTLKLIPVEMIPQDISRINSFGFNSIELKRIAELEARIGRTLPEIERKDFILAHNSGNNVGKIQMIKIKLEILKRTFDSDKEIKIILNEGFAGKKLLTKNQLRKKGWVGDDFTFRKSLINLFNRNRPVDTFDRNMGLPGLRNSCDTGLSAPTSSHEAVYTGVTKTGETIIFSIDPIDGIFDLHLPGGRVVSVPGHLDIQTIQGGKIIHDPKHGKIYLDWEKMLKDNSDVLDIFNTSPEEILKGRARPCGPFLE